MLHLRKSPFLIASEGKFYDEFGQKKTNCSYFSFISLHLLFSWLMLRRKQKNKYL